jgi:hypothetical protein
MKFSLATVAVFFSILPLITGGCAAGSKAGTAGLPAALTATSPRDAVFTGKCVAVVSVEGTLPSGVRIGGVDITLNLPPGVSVKTGKDGQILPEVVTPSGVASGSLSVAKYTPAMGSIPAQLRLAAIKVEGFDAGDVATLSLEVTGTLPKAEDFSTAAMLVIDEIGKPLAGFKALLRIAPR